MVDHGLTRLTMLSTMVVIIQLWLTNVNIVEMVGSGLTMVFQAFDHGQNSLSITIYYETMVNHAFDWGHMTNILKT